ncbi:helix-turn-helix domain-containing protein [Phytomonospora sp. NPDC050363]|uniref:helix-turn-helix domain-containing protein n=1 Tax=Phytomonospora sp. NPDC050363 TaxID=3155642 RepID=UPI0033E904BD
MTFGARLNGHRVRLGLTQERLAERARLGVRTIRDLERDRVARPRPSSIALLADALELGGRERGEFVAAARGVPEALSVAPDRLPAAPRQFVGRETELREYAAVARSGPLVITGPGGVGKTALGVRLAEAMAADCPDGRVYLDLRGTTEPLSTTAALRSLLTDLGVTGLSDDPAELAARWRATTTGRALYLLLDNASGDEQLRPLLPARGSVTVVTGRRALATGTNRALCPLSRRSGSTLLRSLSGQAAVDEKALARVVDACGGLPLSIRMAAARLTARPQWTMTELASRLETVGSGIVLAYRSLTAPSARLLRLLTVVALDPAPCWLGAQLAGLSEVEAATRFGELADAHLVERTAYAEGSRRYRVHDAVRAYAAGRRALADPAADVRRAVERAARAVVAIAADAEHAPGAVVGPLWARLRTEPTPARPGWYEAAMALLHAAVALGPGDVVWRLAAVTAAHQDRRALHDDRGAATEHAVRAADGLVPRAVAAVTRAAHLRCVGRAGEAVGWYARSRVAAMRLGDHPARLHAELGMVEALLAAGEVERAERGLCRVLADPAVDADAGVHGAALRAAARVAGAVG